MLTEMIVNTGLHIPLRYTAYELLELAIAQVQGYGGSEPATIGSADAEKGSPNNPYIMATPAQWMWAANHTRDPYTWYRIGGRYIRRKRSNDYIEDWGARRTVYMRILDILGTLYNTRGGFKGIAGFRALESRDDFRDPGAMRETPYSSIYRRLVADGYGEAQTRAVAQQVRALLHGADDMAITSSAAIPVMTGAMFLAEVHRNPLSLLIGLMMLDMIEAGIPYGTGNKRYTWDKVLWDPALLLPDPQEGTVLDLYGRQRERHQMAGKWPMAHTGSFNPDFFDGRGHRPFHLDLPLVPTRQKEGSLLVRWLAWMIYQRNTLPVTLVAPPPGPENEEVILLTPESVRAAKTTFTNTVVRVFITERLLSAGRMLTPV